MATAGQGALRENVQSVTEASAAGVADAPASAGNSKRKQVQTRSGKGSLKSDAEVYHERVGCGLFWAVGKFRPTNYMIVSHPFPPQYLSNFLMLQAMLPVCLLPSTPCSVL